MFFAKGLPGLPNRGLPIEEVEPKVAQGDPLPLEAVSSDTD